MLHYLITSRLNLSHQLFDRDRDRDRPIVLKETIINLNEQLVSKPKFITINS